MTVVATSSKCIISSYINQVLTSRSANKVPNKMTKCDNTGQK